MNRPTLLLALVDASLEAAIRTVARVGFATEQPHSPTECIRMASDIRPSVVVLSPAIAPWPGAFGQLIRALKGAVPGCAIAVVARPGQILAADEPVVSAEADVMLPADLTLPERLSRWLSPQARGGETVRLETPQPFARPYQAEPQGHAPPWQSVAPTAASPPLGLVARVLRQKVITLWSGKAGVGRSTLTVAVAEQLSRVPGVRVCMVDLHPEQSSLAALVGKETVVASWAALEEALRTGPLTAEAVSAACIPLTPQWALISGPNGHDPWVGLLTPPLVSELVEHLRRTFDYIVLDVPAGRSPAGDAALRLSQLVLLLVSGFYPDVIGTARVLERAEADGVVHRSRCHMVLSPWLDSSELPIADVQACIGLPASVCIPLAPTATMAAARTGRPITQLQGKDARPIQGAVAQVAALITDGIEPPVKRNWFGK